MVKDNTNNFINVWYLFHSGFLISIQDKLLVFDYYNDKPVNTKNGLESGVVRVDDIKNKDIVVFSSHKHSDHYNPVILSWEAHAKSIKYIFSDDIVIDKPSKNVFFVTPDREYNINNINITTLNSTDTGTAFLVEIDGYKIFHAGDLNWWHWNGELDDENFNMGEKYKAEINKLLGIEIDIAFIPVDPRLEEHYILGLDYFMTKIGAKAVFPMHFANTYSVFSRLLNDYRTEAYREKIKIITMRGQNFIF